MKQIILPLLVWAALPAFANERDAVDISQKIQSQHMPFGTILDPMFAAPDSNQITGYTRCGDSAIWTGHYLAAETFRYVATQSPEALDNARKAFAGLKSLVDVTGTDVLARCAVPADSPFAPGILSEEAPNGAHTGTIAGQPYYWIGNTSRDQYSGVLFGLSIAYDGIGDPQFRSDVADLVTRMLRFLEQNDWSVVMPDGTRSTLFLGRFDQEMSFLGVGKQVNPQVFGSAYNSYRLWHVFLVAAPVGVDCMDDNGSYFKFNLDAINLYDLIRLDSSGFYRPIFMGSYDLMRHTTDNHGNAHFNMIDRSMHGPDARRDQETRDLLEAWLKRPRRDVTVDLRGKYAACGENRACSPIPVEERVPTDFLWQRSPFQLYGGGSGIIESAGIDYILPYWMARYYGVISE